MRYSIVYEKIDNTRVNTTFVTKEANEKLVIERFEKMHKHRVTVIECKLKQETEQQKNARLAAFERDLRPTAKPNNWQLIRVDDIKWTQDKSGLYCYIAWDMLTDSVRLDLMRDVPSITCPVVSFIGDADNVRKAFMQYMESRKWVNFPNSGFDISIEHAAYIGSELTRCDTERIDFIQS